MALVYGWFISLSTMFSRSLCAMKGKILFLFTTEWYSIVYLGFFIHSLPGHLGLLPDLGSMPSSFTVPHYLHYCSLLLFDLSY